MTDPRLLLLHPDDNVLICRRPIAAGEAVDVEGQSCTVDAEILLGHKLARRDIAPGEKVLRYGVPIGSATAAIQRGTHVHLHNMKSDYIPPHLRDAVEGRL